jgi:hypothetical protein
VLRPGTRARPPPVRALRAPDRSARAAPHAAPALQRDLAAPWSAESVPRLFSAMPRDTRLWNAVSPPSLSPFTGSALERFEGADLVFPYGPAMSAPLCSPQRTARSRARLLAPA